MSYLTLEVVEGPDAGRAAPLSGTIEIGRDPSADLRLSDEQASRRHARVSVRSGHAVVEDLGSSNGTFLNQGELHAAAPVAVGDELLIGVTVIQVRSAAQVAALPSAVRPIPPALAVEQRRPTFVDAVDSGPPKARAVVPQLDRLVDARTKAQARLAPFAIVVLVALVVVVYLGTQSS
jgi:pSer/pThr/pTyr-binding forkhead associated (FHA) protein